MSTSDKVGCELDPTDSSEEAKKLKLMEEISQMKDVVNIAKQTLEDTQRSIEEEKEETKRKLEAEEEEEMKKYVEELNRMKEKVKQMKAKKERMEGEKEKGGKTEKNRKLEPKPSKSRLDSNGNIIEEEEIEGEGEHIVSPPNPPIKNEDNQTDFSIFNPFTWFKKESKPRKVNKLEPEGKSRKSLSQRVDKKNSPKKSSLFDSVGGISNQFKAIFENNDSIQDLLMDHSPYYEWKKNDIHIWLNKIDQYSILFPNFSKMDINNVDQLESALRERHETLFERVEDSDRMKFMIFLLYAKHDGRYYSYHNTVVSKLCKFDDFLRVEPEFLFQQICMNMTDRKNIKSLLEDQLTDLASYNDFTDPTPSTSPGGTAGGGQRGPPKLEIRIVLMPSPLLSPPSSLQKNMNGQFGMNDLKCPMIDTSFMIGLLIGAKTYMQWSPHGIVLIKRLREGLDESKLVELARLELPTVYDFPYDKVVDVIFHWNTEKSYSPGTVNSVHFVDQILEIVVGEMSSSLELLSVRYKDGASFEILEPIRKHGVLKLLPFENKPIKNWSTLDLLSFYFTLGISNYFTTEFEFDLDGLSLFEADETLLQSNLLDSPRMSFVEKLQFVVFHKLLVSLNQYDMRLKRRDFVIYRKFVMSSFRRCMLGTTEKFRRQDVYEVVEKEWLGGVGMVNMGMVSSLPYLCSVERFESKYLSRFPLSETRIQILCLLEDHAYPIIHQKQNEVSKKYKTTDTSGNLHHHHLEDNGSDSSKKKKQQQKKKKKKKKKKTTKTTEEEDDDDGVLEDHPMEEEEESDAKLLKFRSALLINRSMLVDWKSDNLCHPRTRFYRSDPRNFEIYGVLEGKDLSSPEMKRKLSELLVDYSRNKIYDCGYKKPGHDIFDITTTTTTSTSSSTTNGNGDDSDYDDYGGGDDDDDVDKRRVSSLSCRRNSQQFVDDFLRVCGWNKVLRSINGNEEEDGEQEQEEEEEEAGEDDDNKEGKEKKQQQQQKKKKENVCLKVLRRIRKKGYGIPIFEPSDEFVEYFEIPTNPYFQQYLVPSASPKMKRYRVVFKTHEELDNFVIELLKRDQRGKQPTVAKKDLSRFGDGEYKLLKMYDRLFWHQCKCYERKGTHLHHYEISLPKVKKIGFARKILPGMGTRNKGTLLKNDCLCPFGNPFDHAPRNTFKKRN